MSCYNQCAECEFNKDKGAKHGSVLRPCCVSENEHATFYHKQIRFDTDTSRCPGFKRLATMYELQEVQGLLVREIKLIPQNPNFPQIQLTDYGALELGRQLIRWAKTQDSEINQKYTNI